MLLRSAAATSSSEPVRIFYSYSHTDEEYRDLLDLQLGMLKREGLIETWRDRDIYPGQEIETEISEHLRNAHIILLLISPDFVSSDYCYDREMREAVRRSQMGRAKTIPIILRPTEGWQNAPFGKLMALPTDGRPVTTWDNFDEAFENIAEGIRNAILEWGVTLYMSPAHQETNSQWLLEIEGNLDDFNKRRQRDIVSKLRRLSGDDSITLLKVSPSSVTFLLEGPRRAFEVIDKLFQEGKLSKQLGVPVKSFREPMAASFHAGSVSSAVEAQIVEKEHAGEDLMVFRSEKFAPAVLTKLFIDPDKPSKMNFIMNAGDCTLAGADLEEEWVEPDGDE